MKMFLASLLAVAGALAQTQSPSVLQQVGVDQKLNSRVPLNLQFRNEAGQPVRLGDYFRGRPVVLSLVYYECPMLCTLVLNGMLQTMREIPLTAGRDFDVITVSFNPKETPALAAAKKKVYLADYNRPGAANGWHFLTGDASSIDALTRAVGFRYTYDSASHQYAHPTAIMILTPDGRMARYFLGVEYPARDFRLSLVEASNNKIGTPVDQLLLFCFHYDPSTGKYGPAVLNAMRAGGVLTVLLLGLLVFGLFRKERHAKG